MGQRGTIGFLIPTLCCSKPPQNIRVPLTLSGHRSITSARRACHKIARAEKIGLRVFAY
jgi:hypothetical protein